VPRIVVAPAAAGDLQALVRSHSLPADTSERFRRSIAPLAVLPPLGPALDRRWDGYRFVLGPWRWMIVVYLFDENRDEVWVVAVQDGRSSSAVRARPAP
jgi:hypothetical protein